MDPKQQIERAIEHRRAQAAERNLTRRLLLIATSLGYEIRCQAGRGSTDGFGFDQHQILDADWSWELDVEDTNELPVDEEGSKVVGWQFDGLSSGFNLQVCYDLRNEILKATYQGHIVYESHGNTVMRYLPSPQWEDRLDSLCLMAEKRVKLKEHDRDADKRNEGQGRLKRTLDYLRINWGI